MEGVVVVVEGLADGRSPCDEDDMQAIRINRWRTQCIGKLIREDREAMRHAMELERLKDDSGGNYGAEVKSETNLSLIMRGCQRQKCESWTSALLQLN